MKVTVTHLLSAALMAGLVVAAMPSAVFAAYDYGDARRDQSIINRLAAQGAINPAQAAVMDQQAMYRANSGCWHRNVTPMVTGVSAAPMMMGVAPVPMVATAPMFGSVGMPTGYLTHTQAHFEKAKVDQLFRDHVIGRAQQLAMKRQIDTQTYGNGGLMQPSLISNLATTMAPAAVVPTGYPASYYNNNSMWQRAHNYFHY